MISIKNLRAGYAHEIVFDNLFLDLESNKIHGFVGDNGSGKTTFFNVLYNLIRNYDGYFEGVITFANRSLKRSDIAYLMSENYFYPMITGREYLSIIDENHKTNDSAKLEGMMQLPLDSFIDTYSSGMKKKLALSGVLKLDREVYLLDEPYRGLDFEGVYILNKLIARLKQKGKTVLLSSHMLDTIKKVCDTFFHVSSGSISKIRDIDDFDYLSALDQKYDDIIDQY